MSLKDNGGLLGRKVGMTQIFDEEGRVVPVTVVEAGPCPVLQVKTAEKDGYNALQLGFAEKRTKRTNKPDAGVFAKAGVTPKHFVREVHVDSTADVAPGQLLRVDLFAAGEKINVEGTTIGRGFQGGMKRHGFSGKNMSHGVHKTHRRIGSLSASAYPARVFPGKKMPGHYGAARLTVRNLKVVKVMPEQNLILIRGAVPGHEGAYVVLKKQRASAAQAT